MAALHLIDTDPSRDPRWDCYVAAHPDRVVYQRAGWLEALQHESRRPVVGLALEADDATLHGVMALVRTRGLPLSRGGQQSGRRLSSLPRTPVAGPLADDSAGQALLLRGARDRLPRGTTLQVKPFASLELAEGPGGLTALPWRSTYVVDLRGGPGAVEASFSSGVRRDVRAAQRKGVVVRAARTRADLRAWYRMYLETMRHHMVPARPWRLFEALWDDLRPRGMMQLLLAERDDELLAGSVLLMDGSTAFFAFNGSRRATLSAGGNDALQAHAIHQAAAAGFADYDLGEVDDGNTGLAHFKRKWGAKPRRLVRYVHPPPEPSGTGAMAGEHHLARAWRRIPLGATAVAGRLVVRYL